MSARVVTVLLGVLVAAGWAFVMLASRDTSTAVDVIDTERKAARSQHGQRRFEPGLRPAPGTYVYRGGGSESVSVLGGVKHTYPATIAAVVTLHGAGCEWTLDTTYLEEHTASRRFCTNGRGTYELAASESVRFLSISQVDEYDCGRGLVAPGRGLVAPGRGLVAPGRGRVDPGRGRVGPGRDNPGWGFTCTSADRTVLHELRVAGPPAIFRIDDRVIGARPVVDEHHVSGESQGTITSTTWYLPTGLPIRYESGGTLRSESPVGDLDYVSDEHWKLESLRPILRK